MNTIKKTTLIAAITVMAAIAVPSMASAATWAPLNANKTLTATTSTQYYAGSVGASYSFTCANSTLAVHVRTPASSTLDITSASFTNCTVPSQYPCTAVVTPTGLPWTATTSGSSVSFNEHLQVTYTFPCNSQTGITIDGPATGNFTNATHQLFASPNGMFMYYMGTAVSTIGSSGTLWKDATNTLTLT